MRAAPHGHERPRILPPAGIDAANVCFRGNVAQGGGWPEFMHTPSDVMGDFDLERSRQALEVLMTAVEGLAARPWLWRIGGAVRFWFFG